jgi:hypothetical protein
MLSYLFGCPEPVILREVARDRDGNRERRRRRKYAVIGTSYIHFTETDRNEHLGLNESYWARSESGRLNYKKLKEE